MKSHTDVTDRETMVIMVTIILASKKTVVPIYQVRWTDLVRPCFIVVTCI